MNPIELSQQWTLDVSNKIQDLVRPFSSNFQRSWLSIETRRHRRLSRFGPSGAEIIQNSRRTSEIKTFPGRPSFHSKRDSQRDRKSSRWTNERTMGVRGGQWLQRADKSPGNDSSLNQDYRIPKRREIVSFVPRLYRWNSPKWDIALSRGEKRNGGGRGRYTWSKNGRKNLFPCVWN